jgi:glycosyltransferase involved in cell wall biosynthesis
MKSIYIITNIAPKYRTLLWKVLLSNAKYRFYFYHGSEETSGIQPVKFNEAETPEYRDRVKILKNFYIRKSILVWQKNVLKTALKTKPQAVIITGDSWVLSNWIIALIYKIRGIPVIFWSHGIYGNESIIKKVIRKLFFRLADYHLLYERRGKKVMIKEGFNPDKLHVIFNSLDYNKSLALRKEVLNIDKSKVFDFFKNPKLPTLIFIGRLTPIKKLHYIILALHKLSKHGQFINMLFIGEGSESDNLKLLIEQKNLVNQCFFYGSCYSEKKLAQLIASADVCVSPGNVGLTAIHSFSYGTPVITHGNFVNQMPEVEIITDGITGLFFEENNIDSLAEKIKYWLLAHKSDKSAVREKCFKAIDTYYNPYYQVKVIENLLNDGNPYI